MAIGGYDHEERMLYVKEKESNRALHIHGHKDLLKKA